MTQIRIVQTADGSNTLFSERHNAHYHSLNGALQESVHIFLKNGYEYLSINPTYILEVGFGSGLNAALTASKAIDIKCNTSYTGIELYPLKDDILSKLNYNSILNKQESEAWEKIISTKWDVEEQINEFFLLNKVHGDLTEMSLQKKYNIIYFDAFAPDDQPELWTVNIFEKLYRATSNNGVLVTYCSKGIVKQALRAVGHKVERLAGPPGKRHMIRATR